MSDTRNVNINFDTNASSVAPQIAGVGVAVDDVVNAQDRLNNSNRRTTTGFNSLNNSVMQIGREMPAFANSMNTGFMAISNNIPALFDALDGIRERNRLLAASGQATVSPLRALGSALLSWQTALAVGVTLLTLYGAELVNAVRGLDELAIAQKKANEESIKAQSTISATSVQMETLVRIATDEKASSEDRARAYNKIKETLPGLTSATYDQAISTGELKRATDLYIESLVLKNRVETEAKAIAELETQLNTKKAKSYKDYVGSIESYLQSLQPERQRKNIEKTLTAQRKVEEDNIEKVIATRKDALKKLIEQNNSVQTQLTPFTTKPEKGKSAEQLQKEAFDRELKIVESSYNIRKALYTDAQISELNATERFLQDKLALEKKYSYDTSTTLLAISENDKKLREEERNQDISQGLVFQQIETTNTISELEKRVKAYENAKRDSLTIAELEFKGRLKLYDATAMAADAASYIIGENTALGKGLAVAAATIDTYAAIASTLKAFSGIPIPGYAIAQSIAIGLVGLANVKKILSVKVPSGKGSRGGSSANVSGGGLASAQPNVSFVTSNENQIATAINGQQQNQPPIKAYVVASEVKTGQELERNLITSNSL